MKRLLSVSMVFVFILLLVNSVGTQGVTAESSSKTYYVATTGNDSNDGSINAPFKTIAKASSLMVAGDQCIIRNGTYYETIRPDHSGEADKKITYKAYEGEEVIISGCNPLTGWQKVSGNIYKAPMDWDLGVENMVFAAGQLMELARFPNKTSTELFELGTSNMDSGTKTTIVDADLNRSATNYWVGATVIIKGRWATASTQVTGSSGNTLTINKLKWSPEKYDPYTDPTSNRPYYICNLYSELDAEKEWFYNATEQQLYFWAPGNVNPNTLTVEAKSRRFGIDLSNRSHITITGINMRGCGLTTDGGSYNTIQSIKAEYVAHSIDLPKSYSFDNLGLALAGTHNTLRDSEIAYSSGNCIVITGEHNNVINNLIHHANYMGTYNTCISLAGGKGHLVSYNTAHTAGRDILQMQNIKDCIVEYNDLSNPGLLSWDLGTIYVCKEDGVNTEIRYNWLHNLPHSANGIYMDGCNTNFYIHHNTIWDIEDWHALNIGTLNNFILAYENMFDGKVEIWEGQKYGCRVTDSVITGGTRVNNGSQLLVKNNIAYGYDKMKFGGAGHDFTNPPQPTFQHTPFPLYGNRVTNAGFDEDMSSWNTTGQNQVSIIRPDGDPLFQRTGKTRNGYGALQFASGDNGVEQAITSLSPNTTYELAVWVKAGNGESAEVGVKNFGGATITTSVANTGVNWQEGKIQFTTGASDTSATIYMKRTSSGSGVVYGDDFSVVYVNGSAVEPVINHPNPPVADATNYALYRQATTDSESALYPANYGNDHTSLNRWMAGDSQTPHWWQVDLGESRQINTIQFRNPYNAISYQYRIESSIDGVNWTLVVDQTSNQAVKAIYKDTFDESAMRYIKVTFTGTSGSQPVSLGNFKAYLGKHIISTNNISVTATSEQSGHSASLASDGNSSTFWHTQWTPMENLPQTLTFIFNTPHTVSGLNYIPRQDGTPNGIITKYEVYSKTGSTLNKIAEGTWANNKLEKSLTWNMITTSEIQLKIIEGVDGFGSAAEIEFYGKPVETPTQTKTINDNATGNQGEEDKFYFFGHWDYTNNQSGAYENDNHWSTRVNDYYEITFNGVQAKVYGALAPNHGIAAISIDGGEEVLVDFYDATRQDNQLLYTSALLESGQHTIKIRVTYTKNSQSSDLFVTADRIDIVY